VIIYTAFPNGFFRHQPPLQKWNLKKVLHTRHRKTSYCKTKYLGGVNLTVIVSTFSKKGVGFLLTSLHIFFQLGDDTVKSIKSLLHAPKIKMKLPTSKFGASGALVRTYDWWNVFLFVGSTIDDHCKGPPLPGCQSTIISYCFCILKLI